jgi:hypothetical protein
MINDTIDVLICTERIIRNTTLDLCVKEMTINISGVNIITKKVFVRCCSSIQFTCLLLSVKKCARLESVGLCPFDCRLCCLLFITVRSASDVTLLC